MVAELSARGESSWRVDPAVLGAGPPGGVRETGAAECQSGGVEVDGEGDAFSLVGS